MLTQQEIDKAPIVHGDINLRGHLVKYIPTETIDNLIKQLNIAHCKLVRNGIGDNKDGEYNSMIWYDPSYKLIISTGNIKIIIIGVSNHCSMVEITNPRKPAMYS